MDNGDDYIYVYTPVIYSIGERHGLERAASGALLPRFCANKARCYAGASQSLRVRTFNTARSLCESVFDGGLLYSVVMGVHKTTQHIGSDRSRTVGGRNTPRTSVAAFAAASRKR